MKSLLLIPILLLAIIPSLAFATTHQETFPTFYRNMTIFKGDIINVTNTDSQSYQVDGDGFGSGSIGPQGHVTFTFNRLGDFAIFDDLHHNLSGFVNVIDPTLTPIIFTNQTSYNQGDIVDIYGTNLIPVTSQTVTIYDADGKVSQVLNTPVVVPVVKDKLSPVVYDIVNIPYSYKLNNTNLLYVTRLVSMLSSLLHS